MREESSWDGIPPVADKPREQEAHALHCVAAALELKSAGHDAEAFAFLVQACEFAMGPVEAVANRPDSPLFAMAIEARVLHSPRGPEILRPCAILDRASPTLPPHKEQLIRGIFDTNQELFGSGRIPLPPLSGVYDSPDNPPSLSGTRALLVMPRWLGGNPDNVESDIWHHVSRTAARAGMTVACFEADSLTYDHPHGPGDDGRAAAGRMRALEETLSAFRPDIVLFEGNFVPTDRTLGVEWMKDIRTRFGTRVVAFVADCYDGIVNYFGIWAEGADLVVIFNKASTNPFRAGRAGKAFVAASVPFDQALFHADLAEKSEDLVFLGANARSRKELLLMLRANQVPFRAYLHDKTRGAAPDLTEYARHLRTARTTMNTGRIEHSRYLTIATGRCFEAILAKTVVLDEHRSGLAECFVPFVHYVPFASSHQLVMFSQFLARNPAYRERVAEQAHAWHSRHYSSDRFWRALTARLASCSPSAWKASARF